MVDFKAAAHARDKVREAKAALVDPNNPTPEEIKQVVDMLDHYHVPAISRTLWQRIEYLAGNYSTLLARDTASSYENFFKGPEGTRTVENLLLDKPILDEPKVENLSDDQAVAWGKINEWLKGREKFFVLKGYAGTGKTYMMKKLLEECEVNLKFTAPTNKAAKVLSQTLGVKASTIYSLLGIKMVTHQDSMHLEFPKQLPHIPKGSVVVCDEASMVSTELHEFVVEAVKKLKFRVVYVGDPAQLNPIGEITSPVWKITKKYENRAMLKEVMRFDNQLLALSMKIRENMKEGKSRSPIKNNNKDGEGVFVLPQQKFERKIRLLKLEDFADTKVLAWRNKTVNMYTAMIRKNLGFSKTFVEGEVLLLAEPIEQDGQIIGHTDEEGRATQVRLTETSIENNDIPIWKVVFKTDERVHRINIPVEDDDTLQKLLSTKASEAGKEKSSFKRSKLWKNFWEIKRKFTRVRYGYAMTAHRIQGSTLKDVYIDQSDILANSDKAERMRCLYVACTRPQHSLYTF